jgi:uncharacterized tellurite resistance protein B-like protein
MSLVVACLLLSGLLIYAVHQAAQYQTERVAERDAGERARKLAAMRRTPDAFVDDPREAGAVVLHIVVGDAPTAVQRGAIAWVARDMMGVPDADAPTLLARARWIAAQARDADRALDHMTDVLAQRLTAQERRAFAEAVAAIADADGDDTNVLRLHRVAAGLGLVARAA